MKDNIYCHNLRLNLDRPEHLEVHGYLMNYDKGQFKSMNAYIVEAIREGAQRVDFGGKDQLILTDTQLKKLEDRITERIKTDVLNEILKTILGAAISKPSVMLPQHTSEADETEEVDAGLADLALDYFEE